MTVAINKISLWSIYCISGTLQLDRGTVELDMI